MRMRSDAQTVPGFSMQAVCNISESSSGRPTFCSSRNFYSNKLASVTPRVVLSRKLSRREFWNCPTTSEPNYLSVLVYVSNSTRKLEYVIRSESVRLCLQMESILDFL